MARSLILSLLLGLGVVSLVGFAHFQQSAVACETPADPPKRKQ